MVIGKIVEVRGTKILAQMDKKLPPHIIENGNLVPAPQINSYVKTMVGLDIIICQIVGEYLKFDNNQKEVGYLIELEVSGRVVDGKFLGGLRLLPIVEAKIETLTQQDFNAIFFEPDKSITIGTNLFDITNKISLDINRLIPSHIGIFGNTGSGKSNTLTKIIKEYLSKIKELEKKEKSKILIFDLNNEYGENSICDEKDKKIFKLKTRSKNGDKILFNFESISEENWGIILNATERTQMPVIKKAYRNSKVPFNDTKHSSLELIKSLIRNKKSGLFFSVRNYAEKYFDKLDQIRYHTGNNSFYYSNGFNNYPLDTEDQINGLGLKVKEINNALDRFEFELIMEVIKRSESGINYDYTSPLIHRLSTKKEDLLKVFQNTNEKIEDELFKESNIVVIQLGNVNRDIREILPSLIANIMFEQKIELRSDDNSSNGIINIVIDEAHNLLSNDEKNSELYGNSLRIFEKIIKEGRKFGIFLMLSSQRPSDISNTITSQLQNYFIHKLVNPNDIEKIRKTVAYMNEASLNMITVLGQGECIISGNALYIPQYAYIDELENDCKPNSADIILLGENGILEG